MSDYGDDMSDGDEWFYVEEEYMVADELAEHAVQSPPPTTYIDDAQEEWDRFEYFLDIDYASDGYDDVNLEPKNGVGDSKIGKKRKRSSAVTGQARKKHQPVQAPSAAQAELDLVTNSPVVWRSQLDRDVRPKLWEGAAESYALMKDWRETVADTPQITRHSSHSTSPVPSLSHTTTAASERQPPGPHIDLGDEDEEDEEADEEADEEEGQEGGIGLDPAALLVALQQRLAPEGGLLSGMDPEQLMQFALRMANGEDSGDDMIGQMADEMLENFMGQGDDEEEDEEAEAYLQSWIAQHRDAGNSTESNGETPALAPPSQATEQTTRGIKQSLTPPPSQATRSVRHKPNAAEDDLKESSSKDNARKRKAVDAPEAEGSKPAPKKRAAMSYAAPTTTSQAKAIPPKTTRSGRKR